MFRDLFGDGGLGVIVREDMGRILRSNVVTLAITCRGVMEHVEETEELLVVCVGVV